MQIDFSTQDPQARHFRTFAAARIRFALRRLDWLVPSARVQLSDINGPRRGGTDKKCRMTVYTEGAAPVVVTAIATTWPAAIDAALAKAARTLLRDSQREQRVPRSGRIGTLLVEA